LPFLGSSISAIIIGAMEAIMLTAHYLTKTFDQQPLFENVSFSLNPGERTGLVGVNGCGKTTLLRILAGRDEPSSGHINRSSDLRIGYLPQGFELDPGLTFSEVIGQAAGNPAAMEEDLVRLAAELARNPDHPGLAQQYDALLRKIEMDASGQAAQILKGLGIDQINPDFPVSRLSGGQKTRLSLALVLLSDPQLLLLDEPTNHLDIVMLEWLEEWLGASPCAALVVSHDRMFLDHTVTRILEMEKGRLKEYVGNYSAYLEQRQAEIDRHWSAYKDQQEEIKRMEADIARVKAQAAYTERQASSIRIGGPDMKIKGFKSYQQGIAKKVAKKASAREKKLDRYLEDEERVERPGRSWVMRMQFNETPHLGRSVIELDDLSIGYHPAMPLLEHIHLQLRASQRVALTGPNGSGKTTLFKTITGELAPLRGTIRLGSSVHLGYMTQDQSSLDPTKTVVETILPYFSNQTEARSFLAQYLFSGDEPLKPLALLSYGQKARLMLALLVAQGSNCLLLDEPINHLDIPSRTQFESALAQFPGAVLAVVHDRYFIERFADEVWWVEKGGIHC
jgi:ATP-binding cassette, subfamily F, member 3